LVHVEADSRNECSFDGLHQDSRNFAFAEHNVVRPTQVGGCLRDIVDRALHGEAKRHCQNGHRIGRNRQTQNDGKVESAGVFRMPGVALTADARGLQMGHNRRAVRFALRGEDGRVLHGGSGPLKPDDHVSSKRKLISTAGAEWVMAPTETKSVPVSA